MESKIILAGFGGQGILVAGKLLAVAAIKDKKEATHYPSYGAEMRGGTCNCSIVVSEKVIASPVISSPDVVLAFNKPSKDKYEPIASKGAIFIVNSSLVDEKVKRDDLKSSYIDATNIAIKLGNVRATNMVMLGALAKLGIVSVDGLTLALKDVFPNFKPELLELNIKAIKAGYDAI